jgi:hypothetical protein
MIITLIITLILMIVALMVVPLPVDDCWIGDDFNSPAITNQSNVDSLQQVLQILQI